MATSRNKKKLAAVSRETQEYPSISKSQNTSAPGITEEHIAQVFEEIEGRATGKLSQDFSRTESRILGALFKLDEFFLNPEVQTFSGSVPGTFRNADAENQEPSARKPSYKQLTVLFQRLEAQTFIKSLSLLYF